MEEGEYFAIETFGSTGRGRIVEGVSESNFLNRGRTNDCGAGRMLSLCANGECAPRAFEVGFHRSNMCYTANRIPLPSVGGNTGYLLRDHY